MPTTAVLLSGGHIYNSPSGALGDAQTTNVYVDMAGEQGFFKEKSLEWVLSNTTLTLLFSNDDVPTGKLKTGMTTDDFAALHWKDLTLLITGATTQTTSGSNTFSNDFGWKFMKVVLLTTNVTNSSDLYFFNK